MADVALLTLHGMGSHGEGYANGLKSGLKQRLGARWARVALHPVRYSAVFEGPQGALWREMQNSAELQLKPLREFMLRAFGDAVSLEHAAGKSPQRPEYLQIQQAIRAALDAAFDALGGEAQRPVVVVGQSLGGQVISNYLWDAQKRQHLFQGAPAQPTGREAFRALRSLRALFTTGCNIPLYVSGLAVRECFAPLPGMAWHNYYDPIDLLGWPVRPLGDSYQWVHDHAIRSGGLGPARIITSHLNYWRADAVLDPLAEQLRALMG